MMRYKNDFLCGSKTQLSYQKRMYDRTNARKFASIKGIKAFVIEDCCIDIDDSEEVIC